MTQALLAVFPQIPNTIKKNLDEMERESLRLMNESFQLLIRRTSLCVFSLISSGLKETVITPLSQKLEKNITSMNYCTESAFASFFTPRNELKTEQQAEEPENRLPRELGHRPQRHRQPRDAHVRRHAHA